MKRIRFQQKDEEIADVALEVMQSMSPKRKRKLNMLLNAYQKLMEELDKIFEEVRRKVGKKNK